MQWSKKHFGSVRRESENKMQHLVVAKRIASSGEDASHMQQLEKEINSLLNKEAKMWNQH